MSKLFNASTEEQKDFLQAIHNFKNTNKQLTGFCYWGASLVAYKGTTATDGYPWENQALWDFYFKVTPAMDMFKN